MATYIFQCGGCSRELTVAGDIRSGVVECPYEDCDGGIDLAWHYAHAAGE